MKISFIHVAFLLVGVIASVIIVFGIVRDRRLKSKISGLGFDYIGEGDPFRTWGKVSVPPVMLTRLEGTRIENLCKGKFMGSEAELFDLSVLPSDGQIGEVLAQRFTVLGFKKPQTRVSSFLVERNQVLSGEHHGFTAAFSAMPNLRFLEQAGEWTIFYRDRVKVDDLEGYLRTAHECTSFVQS
jgi:hypothetical protein